MSDPKNNMDRLLASAAAAPRELPGTMPFGFATRVLAQLRPDATAEENAAFAGMIFRRALVCGFVLMLIALAVSFGTHSASESTEMLVANSAIELSLP